MKIAFLGDSLTWGGYGGDFVAHIAAMLPEHEIINAGVGGNTVVNLLRRVHDVIAQAPDIIFVMVGGNDCVSYIYPQVRGYYKKSQNLESGFVSPDEYASTYRDLLTEIQLHHIQPVVGIAPTEYNRELLQARQVYHDLAREAAASMNIPLLDLTERFQVDHIPQRPAVNLKFIQTIGEHVASGWDDYETERQKYGYTYTFDGMHLTPAAAQQFAAEIVAFLKDHYL